jgi:streptogramin lyase
MGRVTLEILPVPGFGTEDVAVVTSGRQEGSVYTGTEDGNIWRVSPDGRRMDLVANTGGRPLGIEIGPDRRLVVCDTRGLLRVDPAKGNVETLVAEVEGTPMCFCNFPADGFHMATVVREHEGLVWMSSLREPALAFTNL